MSHTLVYFSFFCSYCETQSCQLDLAPNTGAIQQMLRYSLLGEDSFNRILIANCFFRMSRSLETHKHLSSPAILEQVLEFSEVSLRKSMEERRASDYTLIV